MVGNLLQIFLADEAADYETKMWVYRHYGSASRAIYTVYEITFAGNWPVYARPVIEKVHPAFSIFFIVYTTVVVFAIIRVVSAIFLKETLEAAQNDSLMQVQEKMKKKALYVSNLEGVFRAIDEDGGGLITEDKLEKIIQDPKVQAYFQTLELDVHEGTALFHLMDNGDGALSCDEFISGVLRCKGTAKAIDQLILTKEFSRLEDQVTYLIQALERSEVIPMRSKRNVKRRRSLEQTFKALRAFSEG